MIKAEVRKLMHHSGKQSSRTTRKKGRSLRRTAPRRKRGRGRGREK
jgi:hypothetical protein